MSEEAKIWGKIAQSIEESGHKAQTEPVTEADILSPDDLDTEKLLSESGIMSAFSVSALNKITRHHRAVKQFGNPYSGSLKADI